MPALKEVLRVTYLRIFVMIAMLLAFTWIRGAFAATAADEAAPSHLTIEWRDEKLTVRGAQLPGGVLEIQQLEAFCRKGAHDRDWQETVIPHRTRIVTASSDKTQLVLESMVGADVKVTQDIRAGADSVTFKLSIRNNTDKAVDIEWAQPCIRVGTFTGLGQDEYIRRCFIYTERGLTTLDKTRRTEDARYRGGQVYVPAGINAADVNPRPISLDKPTINLIGCISADGKWLLATAWDQTEELFQGIIACIHADFRIGGLQSKESKNVRGVLYILPNAPDALLARYRADFP